MAIIDIFMGHYLLLLFSSFEHYTIRGLSVFITHGLPPGWQRDSFNVNMFLRHYNQELQFATEYLLRDGLGLALINMGEVGEWEVQWGNVQ